MTMSLWRCITTTLAALRGREDRRPQFGQVLLKRSKNALREWDRTGLPVERYQSVIAVVAEALDLPNANLLPEDSLGQIVDDSSYPYYSYEVFDHLVARAGIPEGTLRERWNPNTTMADLARLVTDTPPKPKRRRWIWGLFALSIMLLVAWGVQRRSAERAETYDWIEMMYAAGFQLSADRPILLTPRAVMDELLQGRGEWWLVTIRDDDESRKLISHSPQCPQHLSIIVRAAVSDAAVQQLRVQYPETQIMTAGAYQDGEVQPGR